MGMRLAARTRAGAATSDAPSPKSSGGARSRPSRHAQGRRFFSCLPAAAMASATSRPGFDIRITLAKAASLFGEAFEKLTQREQHQAADAAFADADQVGVRARRAEAG
jgi:hypothetical protein